MNLNLTQPKGIYALWKKLLIHRNQIARASNTSIKMFILLLLQNISYEQCFFATSNKASFDQHCFSSNVLMIIWLLLTFHWNHPLTQNREKYKWNLANNIIEYKFNHAHCPVFSHDFSIHCMDLCVSYRGSRPNLKEWKKRV